ncbi:hypothetical protein NMY22_g6411 [Coprinellus aureogranulatus]|nr:hypothetical protein NMY22_g6411 [Coprinellus aureogranulatus]
MSVDEETAQIIIELLPQFQIWQIVEYTLLASYAALFYYYLTSFHEEVTQIWRQKRYNFGKILFLTTRYTAMVHMIFVLFTNCRNYMVISIPEVGLNSTVISATLWLCLYALLECKGKYLWILIVTFWGFSLPISILHLNVTLSQEVALLAGSITIFVRYRKQNHNLIRVIKREGGFYYIFALVFRFIDSLSINEGSIVSTGITLNWGDTKAEEITDQYGVFFAFRWLLVQVFVDRLLLQMRKIDDPGTQGIISSLIFGEDNRAVGSTDSSGLDIVEEDRAESAEAHDAGFNEANRDGRTIDREKENALRMCVSLLPALGPTVAFADLYLWEAGARVSYATVRSRIRSGWNMSSPPRGPIDFLCRAKRLLGVTLSHQHRRADLDARGVTNYPSTRSALSILCLVNSGLGDRISVLRVAHSTFSNDLVGFFCGKALYHRVPVPVSSFSSFPLVIPYTLSSFSHAPFPAHCTSQYTTFPYIRSPGVR